MYTGWESPAVRAAPSSRVLTRRALIVVGGFQIERGGPRSYPNGPALPGEARSCLEATVLSPEGLPLMKPGR